MVRSNMQDHQKKSKEDIRKVRRMQKLDQDRLITHLDNQSREIHDHDKIIVRIEEFYTMLYDSEQSTMIHIDPKETPEITSWEVGGSLYEI